MIFAGTAQKERLSHFPDTVKRGNPAISYPSAADYRAEAPTPPRKALRALRGGVYPFGFAGFILSALFYAFTFPVLSSFYPLSKSGY